MDIMSFAEWQKKMVSETCPEDRVTCPSCEGEGEIYEVCDCCGHEEECQCELCNGDGNVLFGELDAAEQKKCFPLQAYRKEVEADLRKVSAWTDKSLADTCMEFGYALCARISDKQEIILPV